MGHPSRLVLIALALSLALPAASLAVVLSFEGLQDLEEISSYYDGGFGSLGSGPGPDLGIVFSPGGLAVIDSDAGGSGNFANEPSADTAAGFLTVPSLVMNVLGGFTTQLSFFYTANDPGTVTIYDGLDGTGNVLAVQNLAAQGTFLHGCAASGDPLGGFACWDQVDMAFAGTARSVDFGGIPNQIGFDDISLAVPEPRVVALLGTALFLIAALRRRRTP